MVLESLLNPFALKRRPWEMFFAGFFNSLVAVLLSNVVFKEGASLLLVFLIVLSLLPMLYVTIKNEEELDLDLSYQGEWSLLKEHSKVLLFLLFLFFGTTLGLTACYVFLPEATVQTTFALQEQAIISVNSNLQASLTGGITRLDFLNRIFMNNIKVLFFCLVFSLLYGTGALFILTWNSSVIAAAFGSIVRNNVSEAINLTGATTLSVYFSSVTHGFFRYMTHGILEIAAYFVAGLAGGIISVALIKHNFQEDRVLIDVLDMVLISLGILFVAAVVEVFITPALFA
ncbi:hypothetical protein COV20_04940 [Candidatus Woesearchaeota archaeon CG10_big_fil_rev_8_21_14_0_10_45_16]|nr:MAG: hypothetical protein COV20_04940 [Candidatus Woesearchaeota archaeon CG10_big_fil_rev_8_21_14_0_10_45_16]